MRSWRLWSVRTRPTRRLRASGRPTLCSAKQTAGCEPTTLSRPLQCLPWKQPWEVCFSSNVVSDLLLLKRLSIWKVHSECVAACSRNDWVQKTANWKEGAINTGQPMLRNAQTCCPWHHETSLIKLLYRACTCNLSLQKHMVLSDRP